jgi:PTH1 family peptidyl-tRNA hydrolase
MFGFFKGKKTEESQDMWLLVGLGNPGDKYAGNRHNIGFMAIDRFADDLGFPVFQSKFEGLKSEKSIDNQKVILLKPTTYMNESGKSVKAAAKFFKIEPKRIVIFHDELDLAPGKIKVRLGGGNAGHNGLKSIQAHFGTPDFWRVRMGIGHPGDKNRVHGYVLSDFAKSERDWVENLNGALSRHLKLLLEENVTDYASKVAMDAPPKA